MGHSNHERTVTMLENETLAVIREEQCSPAVSSVKMDAPVSKQSEGSMKQHVCACHCRSESQPAPKEKRDSIDVEQVLKEKEADLKQEFETTLAKEIAELKERFDFILRNEEVRAAQMLQEAHRERQEKITALQAQLECKNLAGLMFVMCAERRKRKLERLRLIEEYTGYIRALQSILNEGQQLILHLSRGYKTAARVDHEWREKMKKVIGEFQAYILHFGGGTLESNQYLLDLPALLATKAATHDDPNEDPIQRDEIPVYEIESETNKTWFDMLDGECRPFVMFGDMAELKPPQRRQVLGAVKAAKTAPHYWKEYVFNEMFLNANCSNADYIKDEYPRRLPSPYKWECTGVQTDAQESKTSLYQNHRRATTTSLRGDMGSILKIITSTLPPASAKSTLLAARDSIEIASSTKLRDKFRQSMGKVVLNVGNRKVSLFDQLEELKDEEIYEQTHEPDYPDDDKQFEAKHEEDEVPLSIESITDSLKFVSHKAEKDSKINYEKVCPMEKCHRMKMDSFMRTLPPYMRASPFTHFEQTFDDYEICSPEQLKVLKQRIEEKKKSEKVDLSTKESDLLHEWSLEVEGVGVQTSLDSIPPCTCVVPSPTPVSSVGRIFDMSELVPVKQTMDEIRRDCFYDADIEFNRFKVLGQVDKRNVNEEPEENFTKKRLTEIKKILKKHPSLCEIFQANTQC